MTNCLLFVVAYVSPAGLLLRTVLQSAILVPYVRKERITVRDRKHDLYNSLNDISSYSQKAINRGSAVYASFLASFTK